MSRKSSVNKIKRSNAVSKNVEAALIMNLYEKGHSPITSHFTSQTLMECDVISVSKTDYVYEYEIKISRSDFKADFKKDKHRRIVEKQFILESRNENFHLVPNCFYFVVPENLVTAEEVPDYAGLIYMKENLTFEIIKKAPFIHKIRATDRLIRSIAHNLMCKLVFNKII